MRRATRKPRPPSGPRQLDFFDVLRPQRRPSAGPRSTKRAAAESIAPHKSRLCERVLAFIRGRGARGATDEETTLGLAMRSDTARARRCELADTGLVIDSGQRRPTLSGRRAVVWVAAGGPPDGTGPSPAEASAGPCQLRLTGAGGENGASPPQPAQTPNRVRLNSS